MESIERAGQLYETIGHGYASARAPDPRIAEQILAALGPGETVLNVGAGSGNYEPRDRSVIAVEPSAAMLGQRVSGAPAAKAIAEHLPFADDAFEVAMAIFTIHHWTNRAVGLTELGRVSARQVCLVYDTDVSAQMWLLDYFPELATAPWEADAPTPESVGQYLNVDEVRTMWVPPDCTDGFTAAYWNRPERYLEPSVQAGMSTLARLGSTARADGSERLRIAIDSGDWDRRHGSLRTDARFDMGYRLVLSHSG